MQGGTFVDDKIASHFVQIEHTFLELKNMPKEERIHALFVEQH